MFNKKEIFIFIIMGILALLLGIGGVILQAHIFKWVLF